MKILIFSGLLFSLINCSNNSQIPDIKLNTDRNNDHMLENSIPASISGTLDTATLAAGCFWCVEAIFQDLIGVEKVSSGYTGGKIKNPSYREICTGTTGHAEAVQILFDPAKLNFKDILEVFWSTHDPTTLNRQGADKGTQYRSAIFYHNENQKKIAEESKASVAPTIWNDPIVTEILAFTQFYEAEDYHQDYFNENKEAPYCQIVIAPKIQSLKLKFADKLKSK